MDRNRTLIVVGGSVALLVTAFFMRGKAKEAWIKTKKAARHLQEEIPSTDDMKAMVRPLKKRAAQIAKNGKAHV